MSARWMQPTVQGSNTLAKTSVITLVESSVITLELITKEEHARRTLARMCC